MVDIEAVDSTERNGSMQLGNRLEELVDTEFLAFGEVVFASVVI